MDVNKSLFDWANVNIVDEEDDVYVMHFTRTKKTGMSAIRTASTQRAGVTVVDIAAVAAKEDDSVRPKVPPEWCPDSVIDAMNKRRSACHTCAASVFEVDLDAGFGTAEVRRPKRAGRAARRGRSETVSWFFFRRRRVREKRENDADKKPPSRRKRQECIAALSRGEYAAHPAGLPEALVVPTPDIVCVGSRGQKLLKRLVLGSVSTATLASSNVPVCVYRADMPAPSPETVRTRFKLGDDEQGSRAVCIALSGSDASHTVIAWSLATLLRPSDRVVLLHCDASRKAKRRGLSEEHVTANLRACEETVRDWMARRRDARGVPKPASTFEKQAAQSVISLRLEESKELADDVRDRLVDFLEKTDVQLLVIGRSNRAGGFNAWSLGTVPMYCVTHGPCPVLVVNARGAFESPAA